MQRRHCARAVRAAAVLGTLGTLAVLALFAAGCKCDPASRGTGGGGAGGGGPARTALPRVDVPRRSGSEPIDIDGALKDDAWKMAAKTAAFVDAQSGRARPRSPVRAFARLLWDSEKLYVALTVYDKRPSSPFSAKDVDPHIWARASGVELMIQPGDHRDNRHYYEVQVDVNRAVWDTRFDDYNRPITGPRGKRRFGHQSWKSGVERAVKVDKAKGLYVIEMALPFAALASKRASTPPKVGDVWRMNFYSFRDGQRHALAWSPLLGKGNFHRASRFGRVRFAR